MEHNNYKSWLPGNFRNMPQMAALPEELKFDIDVVSSVLPFKANQYVVEELIDWSNIPADPIYTLVFPRREMLSAAQYDEMATLLRAGADKQVIRSAANRIRMQLNPHPAGQIDHNVPTLNNELLHGVQHKYRETVLFFPSQGQTCHAYCTFCFRWPQFVGMADLKFASREINSLVAYLKQQPQVTDVLFTGGDPLIMSAKNIAPYIDALLDDELAHIRRIRIGTKALTYWPYRFTSDKDSDDLLAIFRRVKAAGKHLAFMAHINHPRELQPQPVADAIERILGAGAVIRSQSPLLRHINDDPAAWSLMWNRQVELGCVPYYMFLARDTGAREFFSVPLVAAWDIFRKAYQNVSGLARTVRGPSMSATPGKVQVLGVTEAGGEKVITMRFLQGRNPDWVHRPFFAAYNDQATWMDELKPAFGAEKFFFEDELDNTFHQHIDDSTSDDFE